MNSLLDELKAEHALIAGVLNDVKTLGISSKEGLAKLLNAKESLLSHIQKEDSRFYPVLIQHAKSDAHLRKLLDTFASEMEQISALALDFFSKYANGGSGFEFGKDFGKLYNTLQTRIRREENILYAEYEKLIKK